MTYQEAAALFGSTPDAVRARARRSHWRRQRSNDGKTLVLVPDGPGEHVLSTSLEHPPVRSPGRPGEQPEQGEVLRLALELLRDQAAEHRRERRDAEERERALQAEVVRLTGRVADAEEAALESWRIVAQLAQRQREPRRDGMPLHVSPPPRRRWGWLERLLG